MGLTNASVAGSKSSDLSYPDCFGHDSVLRRASRSVKGACQMTQEARNMVLFFSRQVFRTVIALGDSNFNSSGTLIIIMESKFNEIEDAW